VAYDPALHAAIRAVGITPCGDRSCIFGAAGGMATNGGCRCGDLDPPTHKGPDRVARKLTAALRSALAEIARLRALGLEACDELTGAAKGLECRSDGAARRTWAKDAYATAERIRKELTR